jgi:hypothetical protein
MLEFSEKYNDAVRETKVNLLSPIIPTLHIFFDHFSFRE